MQDIGGEMFWDLTVRPCTSFQAVFWCMSTISVVNARNTRSSCMSWDITLVRIILMILTDTM
jgi:hypothetical protein